MPTDPTPTLPYFLPMEQGTIRAHFAVVVPVDDAETTEAEDAHEALVKLVHYYADQVDADPVDVLKNLLATVAGEVAPEPELPPTPAGPTLTDLEAGFDVDVARFASGTMVRVRFGSDDYDDEAEFVFASLCVLSRHYGKLTGYPATDVLQPLAENLDPEPAAWPAEDAPLPGGRPPATVALDGYDVVNDAAAMELEAAAELADQADDRCSYCREVVDGEGLEGDALRRLHDDGLCRPSVHGSRIAAADELLRSAEALEGPRWTAAVAEYLRVVGYQVGDRVAIGTDPRFVIVGTVVGVLVRDAGYVVRPANGRPVPVRRDELRPIVADLLASAGTVVDAAPAGSPS